MFTISICMQIAMYQVLSLTKMIFWKTQLWVQSTFFWLGNLLVTWQSLDNKYFSICFQCDDNLLGSCPHLKSHIANSHYNQFQYHQLSSFGSSLSISIISCGWKRMKVDGSDWKWMVVDESWSNGWKYLQCYMHLWCRFYYHHLWLHSFIP